MTINMGLIDMGTILCVFCAIPMIEKTVFGKTVYRCPKCGRQVKAEDIVQFPDTSSKTVSIVSPADGATISEQPIIVTVETSELVTASQTQIAAATDFGTPAFDSGMVTGSQVIEVTDTLAAGTWYIRASVTWADDGSVSGWSETVGVTVE